MKNRLRIDLFCALCLLLSSAFTGNAQTSFHANGRDVDIAAFNARVRFVMNDIGISGLSLAVIDRGKVVFFDTYGYKRGMDKMAAADSVDRETIFEACSLSKSFLVYIAYKLVDEGKLDLDKPLCTYLEYQPLQHDPRYKQITARMVLSHSSGIENWKYENNPDSLEILSDPGKKYIYSGEGYLYLSKVMEILLKEPYETYMKKVVFEPLGLRRTFCKYEQTGAYPTNYATGHNDFGDTIEIWKNMDPLPPSGVHTTAGDYATLIGAIFDQRHLSRRRVDDILKPVVRMTDKDSALFYGPGFEVLYYGGDTLISHGGNNPGFKNQVFYSMAHQCGIVCLTNSDLGKLLASELTLSALRLDVRPFFKDDFYEQYPSNGLVLFKLYREKGEEAMLSGLAAMEKNMGGKIGMNTLNHLADMVASGGKMDIARKLAEENTRLYPTSAEAFYLLGEISLYQKDFEPAYRCLKRAKELNYDDDPGIDYDIKKCADMLTKK